MVYEFESLTMQNTGWSEDKLAISIANKLVMHAFKRPSGNYIP